MSESSSSSSGDEVVDNDEGGDAALQVVRWGEPAHAVAGDGKDNEMENLEEAKSFSLHTTQQT